VDPDDELVTQSLLKAEGIEGLGLTEHEKAVLRFRFGLQDGTIRTREEVGKEFDMPPEVVHTIENKALYQVRQHVGSFAVIDLGSGPGDSGGGSRVREPLRPSPGSGSVELPT
jgi:DNA-directed RNA polymerase sigma subunit (sigma70/sigma32)